MSNSPRVNVIHVTEAECRAQLDAIYAEFPTLVDKHRVCCGGCAEADLGDRHGWDSPILHAWRRVDNLRFLLGEKS